MPLLHAGGSIDTPFAPFPAGESKEGGTGSEGGTKEKNDSGAEACLNVPVKRVGVAQRRAGQLIKKWGKGC